MTVQAPDRVRAATVSVTSQLAAKVLHLVLNLVSSLAIVRYLAPDSYGTYVLVLTVVTFAGVVADFGLPKLAVREMVRAGADESGVAGTIIALRLGLAVVAIAGCQGVVALLGGSPVAHVAAAIASLTILTEAVLGVLVVPFQTRVAQQNEAVLRVVAEALETGLILLLIARGASLPWLFVPPAVGLAVALVLAAALTRRRYGLRPRVVRASIRPYLTEAVLLGPALLVGVLYLKLDSLVVAALRPPRDLGVYGAAYQPIEYLFLATAVIINVLFPLLAHAWGAGESDRFLQIYRRGTELLVIMTGFVAVVTVVLAPALVATAFGPAYDDAATPLAVLALALVVMTVNAWQSLVLLAGGHQRVVLRYNLVALGVAVVLCVVLVLAVGPVGAAMSALAVGLFVLGASTRAVRDHMAARLDWRRLAHIGVAGVPTFALVAGLTAAGVPWVPVAGLALVGYLVVVTRLGFAGSIRAAIA